MKEVVDRKIQWSGYSARLDTNMNIIHCVYIVSANAR